jgi:hypothetical protein
VRKADYFKTAMKAGMYKNLSWCVSAFSLVVEDEQAWKQDAHTGRLVRHHTGYYVVTEAKELALIEDGTPGQPLYRFDERLMLDIGDAPNVKEAFETSYGNFLFNWIVMVYAFDDKLAYVKGTADLGKIESAMLVRFEDDPSKPTDRKHNVVYVSDYLRYMEAVSYLRSFSQLCVQAATEKTLLPPPGLAEYKAQLLKENEGHLHDLATIAKIEEKLVAFDAAWLKGDPGEKFLLGGKSRNIVRKKKFLIGGAEVGMQENAVTGKLVANSLHEGWDLTKFPDMLDSSRSGSYNRGAQTALGGVSVKWLLRASGNLKVGGDDCGTTMGSDFLINKEEVDKLVGMRVLKDGVSTRVPDRETAESYLGRVVRVRNPMYCTLPYTDYCKSCLGDRLSVNETGLSTAVSSYGSALMGIFMAKMHGSQLAVAEVSVDEVFS